MLPKKQDNKNKAEKKSTYNAASKKSQKITFKSHQQKDQQSSLNKKSIKYQKPCQQKRQFNFKDHKQQSQIIISRSSQQIPQQKIKKQTQNLALRDIQKNSLNKNIYFKNLKDSQILSQIKKISYSQAKQCCIYNNIKGSVIGDPEIIKELGKIKTLQKLQLKYCSKLNPLIAKQILQSFDANQLKYLNLSYCSPKILSQQFIKQLSQKFSQMKQCYLDEDQKSQDLQYVWDDSQIKQSSCFNLSSVQARLFLSENMKQLQNIQINNVQDKMAIQIIRNMKSLKHLKLNHYRGEVCKQLFKELLKIKFQLKTFRLKNIIITQKKEFQNFLKIIQNNPEIQTLQFKLIDFNNLTNDQLIKVISDNLKHLKRLIIGFNYGMTGKYFQQLQSQSLKFLALQQNCNNINKQILHKKIKEMKNLTHLRVPYLDDQTMKIVGESCKMLQSLHLSQCFVTDKGLMELKHLKNLDFLNLPDHNNKITSKCLIELTSHIKSITKLYIPQCIELSLKDLTTIDNNSSQGITHLYLMKHTTKSIDLFTKFKCLKVLVVQKYQCSSSEIKQLDNYLKGKQSKVYYIQG